MEGMVRKNKDYFSISPRNGKKGWWMMAMISLVIGISMPFNSSTAASSFMPAEDKGSSTVQNSILTSGDSQNPTVSQNQANSDSIKNQIQLAKDGKSMPDTFKVIQGEGCDYDPPYWSKQNPFRGQPNVRITQNSFEFELRDDRSGVDVKTFRLVVDGILIISNSTGLSMIGNPEKYSVRYNLPANRKFFWGDTIWVKLNVCDRNEPPNCLADSMFFVMERDLDPPIIVPAGPMPGDVRVAVNSLLKLSVSDPKAGINFSSIKLFLNGIDYSDSLSISPDQLQNITVNRAQRQIFGYNEQVTVSAEVQDLVGNKSDTTYSFMTQPEPFPPIITFVYPEKNSNTFLAIGDSLVFRIKDQHSQIDTSKTGISFRLNNKPIDFEILNIQSLLNQKEVIYTIRPASLVKCNMIGQLRVLGVDKSGNVVVDSTQVKYQEDRIGPEIVIIKPKMDEPAVSLEHVIEFEVIDQLAGVDKDSIQVLVNGVRAQSLTIQPVDASVKRYRVSLSNTGFWNDVISIKIVAWDLAFNPNKSELGYNYFIKRDDDGPVITLINPLQMQPDVPLKHVIEFEVEDILAGVNSDSIKIEVNGIDKSSSLIKSEIESASKKFRAVLSNTDTWNNSITIKIKAQDLARPSNRTEASFQYFMVKDAGGPLVIAENPKPNQINVMPENVKIQFLLEDDSSGIDLSSLKFFVKDKSIPITDLRPIDKNDRDEINSVVPQIGYTYQAGNFSLGEKVRVRVNVTDDAGNPARGDTDYTFTITKDPYSPKIKIIQPLANAKNVSRYLPVILEVTDLESGINRNSVILKINNQDVKPVVKPNFTNGFTPKQNFDTSFLVEYTPVPPYLWNSTNSVFISVEDSVGHPASLTYQFSAQEDRIGPEFINITPAPNSLDVLSNTPIFIGIRDILSGVDIESFVLTINGVQIPQESISIVESRDNPIDLKNNQRVPEYYFVKYVPPQRFAPGIPLMVQLKAKDLVGNESKYPYSFKIYTDTSKPVIKLITPPSLDNVARKTPVEFEVTDEESGVKMQLTELWVNGKKITINPIQVSGDIKIRVLTDTLGLFDFGAKIPVKIIAVNNDDQKVVLDVVFNIIKDQTPPIITLIQPKNRASLRTPVVFQLNDPETGINLAKSTLEIDRCIDGKVYIPALTQPMIDQFGIKSSVNGTSFEISFNSQGLKKFAYFQQVKIRITTENDPKFHTALNAVFETTITIAPGDTTPPWVTNLRPAANETNAAPGSIIKFDVLDDSMGVEPSSVKVQVATQKGIVAYDSTHKAVSYGKKAFGYEVSITPKVPFFYNDTVTVTVDARDKEPNTMTQFKYRFFLQLDKTKPVLIAINPRDKQKNVTNMPVFKVLAQDQLAGIDKSTYQLRYRYSGENEFVVIDPQFFEFNSDTIQIKPGSVTLEYDTTVVVRASVMDRVGNDNALEYSFRVVKEDTIPPSIALVKPAYNKKYDYHPDNLNEFIVTITDNYAEIKTESVKIIISVHSDTLQSIPEKSKEFQKESATWTGEKLIFSPVSGKSLDVTCIVKKDSLLITKNKYIRMWVYAEDKFRNPVKADFIFGTQPDRQPPILLYSFPFHQAEGISPDTKVTLKLTDDRDGDGKDFSVIKKETARVFMQKIDSDAAFDESWSSSELLFPGPMSWEERPEPIIELKEKSGRFFVNQRIYLRIQAEDIVNNKLDTTIWFETTKETPDLFFQSTNYRLGNEVGTDSVQVECSVIIMNEFARVNASFLSVLFEQPNGKKVDIPIVGRLDVGETVSVTAPWMTIYKYGTQNIQVTIDGENVVAEKNEDNNKTTITIAGKTRVYADPPVFSPNGDGINDVTFIFCDGFDLQNPVVKIVDVKGRFVRELTEIIHNPIRFMWDGRDQNGKIVMPGVYLIIINDGNKTLGSCTVVVVL